MGAEESKHISTYKASHGKAFYPNGAEINRTPVTFAENKHVALQPRSAINGAHNIPDFIDKKKLGENDETRGRSAERPRNHNKPKSENKHRHHSADDILSRDYKSKEKKKIVSRNSNSPTRRKSPRKHRDQKTKEKGQTSKPDKDKKGRDKHSKHGDHKSRSQKNRKQKSETPSSSAKENAGNKQPTARVKNVRNRKRKTDLEKHKSNHRSAPDLTNSDNSKVDAWLNSAAYYWQQDSPAWQSSYGYPYASLPRQYNQTSLDENRKPRPVVDGMGSPVGTMFPDGTFLPDPSSPVTSPQHNFSPPSPVRFGVPPFLPVAYPYQYFLGPQFYTSYGQLNPPNDDVLNDRSNLANHSRSDNHINLMDKDVVLQGKVRRRKAQDKNRVVSSAPPEEALSTKESVSSLPSAQENTVGFYSDIAQTRDSLGLAYKANQEIAVDNVRHANFVLQEGNSSDVTDSSDDSNSSSLSDSSCNDIILDGTDVKELVSAVTSSTTSAKNDASNVKIFQPASKRAIFIDGESDKRKDDKPMQTISKTTAAERQTSGGPKAPIMTLSERESIVATSFLTNGGKVFCLTKAKLGRNTPPPPPEKEETKNDNTQREIVKTSTSSYNQAEVQVIASKADPSNRESGTWFRLTGSPPISKSTKDFSFGVKKESTDLLSESKPDPVMRVITSPEQDFLKRRLSSSSQSSRPLFQKFELDSETQRTPEEISAAHVTLNNNKSDEGAKTFLDNQAINKQRFDLKHQKAFEELSSRSSSSSDSEPLMRDDDQSVARKLVRIDSHDSLTMKRRLRIHRRSSSQSERVPSYPGSLDRRATVGFVSQEDLRSGYHQTTSDNDSRNICVQPPSHKDKSNPFHYSSSPEIDSFLYKAKSEEALKHAMRRSRESLMTDTSPRTKKETLQERAARILGLSSAYAVDTREKQAKALTINPHLTNDSPSFGESTCSLTTVTPTKTAHGNISHSAIGAKLFSSTDDLAESGAFAVSITESMLQRPQNKYEIKSVRSSDDANSSADVSTISEDTVGSHTDSSSTPTENGEYTIEVSDSILEDTSVPVKVQPHKENVYLSPAKEYKLPIDIPTKINSDTLSENVLSPGAGQASIVASYANSIYDHTPGSSGGHSHDFSDDTTETESLLDQSGHHRKLAANSAAIWSSVNGSMDSTVSNESNPTAVTVAQNPSSMSPSPQNEARMIDSPVPIAFHSAPLTSGELDIIMQLYNSAEDTVSTSSKDVSNRQPLPMVRTQNTDLRKQQIAQAIGFDIRNIGQGARKDPPISKGPHLERVEDFDIKVYPAATTTDATATTSQTIAANHKKGNDTKLIKDGDDVLEAMQSLGLNPDESWLVSL